MKVSRTKIKNFLKSRGIYEDVDDLMIDMLIDTVDIMRNAKADIDTNGNIIDDKVNPSVSIFNAAAKNVMALAKKFGLSSFDRSVLHINPEDEDGFDE